MRVGSLVIVLTDTFPVEGSFEGDDHIGIIVRKTPHLSTATVHLLDKNEVVEASVDNLVFITDLRGKIKDLVADPAGTMYEAMGEIQITLFRIHTAIIKGMFPLAKP